MDIGPLPFTSTTPRDRSSNRSRRASATRSVTWILFGGGGSEVGGPFSDTWAYDVDTDTWEQMSPKVSPPARIYAVAAYDAAIDRVILYGGSVDEDNAEFQDTWAYDYDTDTRTRLAKGSPIGPIAWHAMASSDEGVVLFGGGVTRGDYVADTWVLDASTGEWSAV